MTIRFFTPRRVRAARNLDAKQDTYSRHAAFERVLFSIAAMGAMQHN